MRELFPNLGAEEGDAPPSPTPPSHLRLLQEAWARALVVADGLGFSTSGLVAWLNTPRAAATAARRGLSLWGPSPALVRVVHDKGYCARASEALGLVEVSLRGAITVLDVDDCTVDGLVACTIAQPGFMAGGGLVAKPRMSTSGRGRLDLRRGITERAAARLRRHGGAVVEPWLPRTGDYSSQWWIADDGLHFLGATEARQSFAGLWQGSRMWIDVDGIPTVPGDVGRAVVDRGLLLAERLAREGFRGPCGVDVFTWDHDGERQVRLCEINARMTAGFVAVMLARGLTTTPGARVDFGDGVAVVR